MSVLEHKIPPPLVGLLCAGAMWFLANQTPTLSLPSGVRASAAVPILAVGLFVMLAGVISFRRARTTVNPLKPETATALVTSGIYRYTRNPMYLGILMVLIAWATYLASPVAFAGVLAFWAYIGHFQIRPEETALANLFGSAFTDYTRRVRRWL
jgi:protein-S-isoprenylcysteine O-methyltransferase Ste14